MLSLIFWLCEVQIMSDSVLATWAIDLLIRWSWDPGLLDPISFS